MCVCVSERERDGVLLYVYKYSIESVIEETDVSEFDLIKKITYAKRFGLYCRNAQREQNCQQSHHLSL